MQMSNKVFLGDRKKKFFAQKISREYRIYVTSHGDSLHWVRILAGNPSTYINRVRFKKQHYLLSPQMEYVCIWFCAGNPTWGIPLRGESLCTSRLYAVNPTWGFPMRGESLCTARLNAVNPTWGIPLPGESLCAARLNVVNPAWGITLQKESICSARPHACERPLFAELDSPQGILHGVLIFEGNLYVELDPLQGILHGVLIFEGNLYVELDPLQGILHGELLYTWGNHYEKQDSA